AVEPATHRDARQRGDPEPQRERAGDHHARGAQVLLHGAQKDGEAVEDDAPRDRLRHAERGHDDPAVVAAGRGSAHCGRERLSGTSQAKNPVAVAAPTSWAAMKAGTSRGRMPAKVSLADRASVTAGFAKDVDAVNQ